MEYPKVSIIIPVVRPDKAKRCVELAIKNAGVNNDFEVLTEEDTEKIGCPKMVRQLTEKTKYDLVMFLGDDVVPRRNYLRNALDKYVKVFEGEDGTLTPGLVGLNDGENDGVDFSTHWLAHKGILEFLPNNEFFFTGYKHCFCDYELTDHCKERGVYAYAKDAKIYHDHPAFKRGKGMDSHYMRVYNKGVYWDDQKLFWQRKRDRNLNNFYPAISEPNVREYIHSEYHKSFHTMERYKGKYLYAVPDKATTDFPTDWSRIRNNLAVQALNNGCTHHIMFDTDQIVGEDTLRKLLTNPKWADRFTGAVGGMVFERYYPFNPVLKIGVPGAYRLPKEKYFMSNDTIEVDATGCACLMVSTQVYIDMATTYPWFKEVMLEDRGEIVSEDVNFCFKMRGLGYRIYVDTSIDITHIFLAGVNKYNYKLLKKAFRRKD